MGMTPREDKRDEKNPALRLTRVAVCLHFVELPTPKSTAEKKHSDRSVITSMELDLLAYRFQGDPPFVSQHEPHDEHKRQKEQKYRHDVNIIFPDKFEYNSESRKVTLRRDKQPTKAQVLVSSTSFPRSGVNVWHLVVTPKKDSTFSEFDIIKLIHLYDGRTENTKLRDKVTFCLYDDKKKEYGKEMDVEALLHALCGKTIDKDCLKAGTIQIDLHYQPKNDFPSAKLSAELFATVRAAREPNGKKSHEKLQKWMKKDNPMRPVVQAYCGIVTGIFDFDHIDSEEVLDTLEPTFADTSAFLRIHRCTLIHITENDRSMGECWETVGISPYLIVPHAALLNNEEVVDKAEREINTALRNENPVLKDLEDAGIRADRYLKEFYLPNVFNYITERSLFEKGAHSRGSDDKHAQTLDKRTQLKEKTEIEWQRTSDRAQVGMKLFLLFITLIELEKPVKELFPSVQTMTYFNYIYYGVVLVLLFFTWWKLKKTIRLSLLRSTA